MKAQEEKQDRLHDQALVRLFNKTMGLNLCSKRKGVEFYGLSFRPVIYHDNQYHYEKMLNLPIIEANRSEVLKLGLNSRKVGELNLPGPSPFSSLHIPRS